MENQNTKEANEIIDVFKSKLLTGCRHEKTVSKLRSEISTLLFDYKLRERARVSGELKQKYFGFIPSPSPSIKNRLRFLFTGKI